MTNGNDLIEHEERHYNRLTQSFIEKHKELWDLHVLEDIQLIPDLIDGIITNMELTTAKQIFGDKADNPDQKMIRITIENNIFNVRTSENCTFFDKGLVPDNSKLAKIIDFYGELKTDMKVQLLKNKSGFFDIRK